MEQLYRIVFSGDLAPGKRAEEVIKAFSARFQVSETRARDVILASQRLVLKHDLDRRRADLYRAALLEAGLVVALEPQDPPPERPLPVTLPPGIDASHSRSNSQTLESGAVQGEPIASEIAQAPGLSPSPAPRPSGGGAGISDPARCPKCGAAAVSSSNGVCQSCGIVVERYLARLAAERDGGAVDNPYAPSRADLTPPKRPERGEVLAPRGVPAAHAWRWIGEGRRAFAEARGPWIATWLLYALLNVVSGIVNAVAGVASPSVSLAVTVVSALLSLAVGPIVTGGLMLGMESRRRDRGFRVGFVLAGFAAHPGRLAVLGLVYPVLIMVLAGATVALGWGLRTLIVGPGIVETGSGLGPLGTVVIGSLTVLMLVGLLGVGMALAFAPALVAVNDRTVRQALLESFQGCWRNLVAGLLYWPSVAVLLLAVAVGLALVLVIAKAMVHVVGAIALILQIPLAIGIALGLPGFMLAVVIGSQYAAYREIFFGDRGD